VTDLDYKHPDYDPVFLERAIRLKRLRSEKSLIDPLKSFYRDHPAEFIHDWGCTSDPRNAEVGLPVVIPFLLFDRQREYINWLMQRWGAREDGLVEKSRDMGVSWLSCAFGVWMYLFRPATVVGFGSRKEEYVDKIGDPKSLFSKIRQFISLLPYEFRPVGYEEGKHALYMRIINPENGSAIIGEAGANIGRGNRTSIYFKDESAFYEQPELVDAALSQTSNCKIDVSTPNGNGNPFYRKRHGGKIPIFSFHWTQDPRKGQVWYDKQREILDPVILAQEVDLDYNASVADTFIDGEKIARAQQVGPADVFAAGQWIVAIDAAHFGDDESVIHARKGRLSLPQISIRGADGPTLAGRVLDECYKLERTGDDVYAVVIELDGPGVSCYDQLRRSQDFGKKVRGVHTGARVSEGRVYNLRSKMWLAAKEYIDEGVPIDGKSQIALPRDPEFKSQLASIKYTYKDGQLLMQSKKDYKSAFGKSPDRADAFALTFAVDVVIPKSKPKVEREVFAGNWM
jgi:phage terminase large subunit